MRNGILWVAPLFLASASLVAAQPSPTLSPLKPPVAPTLPDSPPPLEPKIVDLGPAKMDPVAAPKTQPKPVDLGPARTEVFVAPAAPATPRLSVSTEYLLWWVKGGPLNTPLVTTGSLPDVPPGALGQPSTRVLFGDRPLNYGNPSGVRFGAAYDLGNGIAIEGNYFILQTATIHYSTGSDAAGNPRITRPFFNNQFGLPDTLGTAEPSALLGPFAGTTAIASHSQLQGWELNLSARQQVNCNWSFVGLAGFRALQLDEDLIARDNLTQVAPGVLTFLGAPIGVGDTVSDFDRFHVTNRFYGGQVGGRLEWQGSTLAITVTGKVAVGVNQQIANVDGGSSWTSPAGLTTAPGGVLALPTNMGRFYHHSFSVVPEGGITAGWNITPRVKATLGYNVVYWTHVARPGSLIDPNLNSAQIPTSQLFGTPGGTARPSFNFQNSDYWAQGVSLGLEFKF